MFSALESFEQYNCMLVVARPSVLIYPAWERDGKRHRQLQQQEASLGQVSKNLIGLRAQSGAQGKYMRNTPGSSIP
jgi:hypothetical protein